MNAREGSGVWASLLGSMMDTNMLSILTEPAGETYLSLLRFAVGCSGSFSLVWRRQLEFERHAQSVAETLSPLLQREEETDEWPGTRLFGHTACVRHYRLAPEAMMVLSAADRLYNWLAPKRPEDLAFYSSSGACWLGSIAHERDAFIHSEQIDVAKLRAHVPGLEMGGA